MKIYTKSSCLLAGLFLFSACAVNPVTGKKQVVLMSEAQEIALGKEADPQIIQQYGLYEDKALQDFITEKGKKMAAISHRPNLDYQFRILDSDALNAFALPGGYVYFTRGIMAYFNNEAQFAGVLGHEIGHITARHGVAQQRNAMLGQVGLIAGMVVAPKLADFAEQASQGLGLLLLKFGRDDERQSDALGVEYSSKIGYDATEMAGFFSTLERDQTKNGGEALPDFLSSHPNPGDRNITVGKLASDWKQKLQLSNPEINRSSYLKRIEGLIYGNDPKQGFVENSIFYHPVLKFQFALPKDWAYQNTPQRVQVAPKDGKALIMMSLAPGKTLEEAATEVLSKNNLNLLESKDLKINGLTARVLTAEPKQNQQEPIRTLSYLIQYGDVIYHILGVTTTANFSKYTPDFNSTMESFKELKDLTKLNKKPERIRIKTVQQDGTLEQALKSYKVDAKRMEEFSILNGLKLSDNVGKGSLIKVVEE